jgi:hypothetical protein
VGEKQPRKEREGKYKRRDQEYSGSTNSIDVKNKQRETGRWMDR